MKQCEWYALRVRGGREEKIKEAVQVAIGLAGVKDSLGKIYIPFQQVYAMRNGKKRVRKKHFGYLLVEINLKNVLAREALINVNGVMGFVTASGWSRHEEPVPLKEEEVTGMFKRETEDATTNDEVEGMMKEGDQIEIIEGAFKGNTALVKKVDNNSKKVKVMIRIFKLDVEVEFNVNQVKSK